MLKEIEISCEIISELITHKQLLRFSLMSKKSYEIIPIRESIH